MTHDCDNKQPLLVLVTGPSGAGRTTAINTLEDLGYETIDNLPLSLLPRVVDGPLDRPLALGIDVRNRDFNTQAFVALVDQLGLRDDGAAQILYLDADNEELVRRYSNTRRRHPLAGNGPPLVGIEKEKELLLPIRDRADELIDTTVLNVHELRSDIDAAFSGAGGRFLGITVHSFSYKRGLPRGVDIILDCRFLTNPHWEPTLRALDGRDLQVQGYVAADPRFAPYFDKIKDLIDMLLPAQREEGKSHVSIGFGCTGGKHRSVTMAEKLSDALAQDGWQVSKRHRELERQDGLSSVPIGSNT